MVGKVVLELSAQKKPKRRFLNLYKETLVGWEQYLGTRV